MELIVEQRTQETKEAVSLSIARVDGCPVVYEPGQFITLVFPTPFGEKRRSYSFSSAPAAGDPPTITIKKIENGEFSRKLVDQSRSGDYLVASSVSGLFTLPKQLKTAQQFFFFAAGSGITPCYSLIKTLLFTTSCRVVLIYSNHDKESTIFYHELLELRERFNFRFDIRLLFSNLFDIYNSRLGKWLLPQLLEQYRKAEKALLQCYVCGPWDYMQMVQLTLLSEDIALHQIHKEQFSTVPRVQKPVPPDTDLHKVLVDHRGGRIELEVQYPNTILAAAKAAGIDMPYSCESGRCGSCVATCTQGKVWMAYNEVLMEEEVTAGRFLCCQAYPVGGDIEILF